MAYNVGAVYVSVIPSFTGVAARITAEAAKWSADIERQLSNAVKNGLNGGFSGNPGLGGATRTGNQLGGALGNAIRARVSAALRALPKIDIDANTSPAVIQIQRLRGRIEALGNKTIGVDISYEDAVAQMKRLERQARELGRTSADIQVKTDALAAAAELRAARTEADRLNGKRVRVDVDGSSLNTFSGRLVLIGQLITSLAPAALPALGAITVAIGGLATASLSVLPAVGALVLAFKGIGDAVKAYGRVQDEAFTGKSNAAAVQQAASVRNAARAVETAQRAIGKAQQDAARNEIQAGRSIEDAQRKVADARDDAARTAESSSRSISTALRAQVAAEKALERAQQNARDVQLDLTTARKDASEQLEDLNDRVRQGALDQRAAVLAVAAAQKALGDANRDASASGLDRAEAQLAYEEAVQGLDDVTKANRRLGDEAAEANKKGVEGSDQVVQAQQRIADAQTTVADATQDRDLAVQNSAQVQADAALAQQDAVRKISDAQRDLSDSFTAQAYSQQQAADSIASARDALLAAQQAAADTAVKVDTASASVGAFDLAMSKLGPSGRAFVDFLVGIGPAFRGLNTAAEDAVLPRFQTAIEGLLPVLPQFERIISIAGAAVGDLAIKFSEFLNSENGKKFLDLVERTAGPAIEGLGKIAGSLFNVIFRLGETFEPVMTKVLDGLAGVFDTFANFLTDQQGSKGFQDFLDYVDKNGPKFSEFLSSLVDGFTQFVKSAAPMGPVVLAILGGIFDFIASLPPGVIQAVVLAILGIVGAFTLLAPILNFILPIINAIMLGLPIFGTLIAALGGPVTVIIAAIIALGAALFVLYQRSETFRNIVNTAFKAVGDAAVWLYEKAIKPAFDAIVGAIKFAWENIILPVVSALVFYFENVLMPVFRFLYDNVVKPVFAAISKAVEVAWVILNVIFYAIKTVLETIVFPVIRFLYDKVIKPIFESIGATIKFVWENVVKPVFEALGGFIQDKVAPAFSRGVDAIESAWNRIKEVSRTPIAFVVDQILNNGIFKAINSAADFFGVPADRRIKPIELGPEFYKATGGTIPGFSPTATADNVPIMATAGEFMQPVSAVKYYGADFMEAIRKRRIPKNAMQHLANGGKVEDLVAFGRKLQGLGLRVSENKFFGGVSPTAHSKGGWHYKLGGAGAIDVNLGVGNPRGEKQALDGAVKLAQAEGFRSIWQSAGHFDHAHFDLSNSQSILGKIGSVFGSLVDHLNPLDAIKGLFNDGALASPFGQVAAGIVQKPLDWAKDFVSGLFNSSSGDSGGEPIQGDVGSGVERWRGTVLQALGLLGLPTNLADTTLRRMNQESGGNPNAINNWDSNAKKGIPSKGLMQVIDPTFRANALPGYNSNVYDPLSNILASMRYALGRYGSLPAAYNRRGGYATGGLITPTLYDQGGFLQPGMTLVENRTKQPELIFRQDQLGALLNSAQGSGGGGDSYTFTGPIGYDPASIISESQKQISQRRSLRPNNL